MKDWQHGYDLNFLKDVEKFYDPYNKYSLSPFSKMKKNNIAEALDKDTLLMDPEVSCAYKVETSKVRSKIVMFQDVVIGTKEQGDSTISFVCGDLNKFGNFLNLMVDFNLWWYVWAEDREQNEFALNHDFRYVGAKISTFGEVYSIYFRDANNLFKDTHQRPMPIVDPIEFVNIKKVMDVDLDCLNALRDKITNLPDFTVHYSNYNYGKNWSALSLRGYKNDPGFITKPIEMDKKWQALHAHEDFHLQDTPLREMFPEVDKLLKPFDTEIHRIRFMKLRKGNKGNSELGRHTDQVDPDSGTNIGKLARLHFPIITNDQVVFSSWNANGEKQDRNMKYGECWVLNTLYPHSVVNGGDDRIHLVVDVVVTEDIKKQLLT